MFVFIYKWLKNAVFRRATLSTLTGQTVDDPKAAAAGLPAPDSKDMWQMLTGASATSPRDTMVLRAVAVTDEGAIIKVRQRISFPMQFILKMTTLPRQAREKHRTSTQQRALRFFLQTVVLPGGSDVPVRVKLVAGGQGGYYGGQYAPNNTKAVSLPVCAAGEKTHFWRNFSVLKLIIFTKTGSGQA